MMDKASWKRVSAISVVFLLLLGSLAGALPAGAATGGEIEDAITDGLAWLAGQQNADGSWSSGGEDTSVTCFALVKFQERAYELGYDSPFDPDYGYYDQVLAGWDFVFNRLRVLPTDIGDQDHTAGETGTVDDPDTNGNGYGVYFQNTSTTHPIYSTGVCLMALHASRTPNRQNEGGLNYDGDADADTYFELAQEATDWLAFAQTDYGWGEGGWHYLPNDNDDSGADQSNSGFAALGLGYAEDFGCNVPDWVKTELNAWLDYIQCTEADGNYGGAGYTTPCEWTNQYKAGHLIFQMTFYGDDPSVQRFDDALAYIDRHWQNPGSNMSPGGWGYSEDPADYLAMYSLMKGLVYSGIDTVDTDGDTSRDDDWYNQEPPASPAQDFASVLVNQQEADGSWTFSNWGDPQLSTIWALLTLEKTAPPPPEPPPEPPPPEPPPAEAPFVPEASTLLLLGSGLTGLAGYAGLQWRARRKK